MRFPDHTAARQAIFTLAQTTGLSPDPLHRTSRDAEPAFIPAVHIVRFCADVVSVHPEGSTTLQEFYTFWEDWRTHRAPRALRHALGDLVTRSHLEKDLIRYLAAVAPHLANMTLSANIPGVHITARTPEQTDEILRSLSQPILPAYQTVPSASSRGEDRHRSRSGVRSRDEDLTR